MNSSWSDVSEKLNKEVYRADEIIESLLNEDPNDIEIAHWWNFLSKISYIPRDELILRAKKIKESNSAEGKKDFEYCGLLAIEGSVSHQCIEKIFEEQLTPLGF